MNNNVAILSHLGSTVMATVGLESKSIVNFPVSLTMLTVSVDLKDRFSIVADIYIKHLGFTN